MRQRFVAFLLSASLAALTVGFDANLTCKTAGCSCPVAFTDNFFSGRTAQVLHDVNSPLTCVMACSRMELCKAAFFRKQQGCVLSTDSIGQYDQLTQNRLMVPEDGAIYVENPKCQTLPEQRVQAIRENDWCPDNQEMVKTIEKPEKSCGGQQITKIRSLDCSCKPGFVRREYDQKCVKPQDCPQEANCQEGEDELAPGECYSESRCGTFEKSLQCYPTRKCVCSIGHCRDENGKCVKNPRGGHENKPQGQPNQPPNQGNNAPAANSPPSSSGPLWRDSKVQKRASLFSTKKRGNEDDSDNKNKGRGKGRRKNRRGRKNRKTKGKWKVNDVVVEDPSERALFGWSWSDSWDWLWGNDGGSSSSSPWDNSGSWTGGGGSTGGGSTPVIVEEEDEVQVAERKYPCGKPKIRPSTYYVSSSASTRIVGGTEARKHSWPWQVYFTRGCGGSLFKPDIVISAAHCFSNGESGFTAEVGGHDRSSYDQYEQKVQVVNTVIHPNYDGNAIVNDIAILKLKRPIVYDDGKIPICLPTTDVSESGGVCVSGWGYLHQDIKYQPRKLQQVCIPMVSDSVCKKWYGYSFDPYKMICAGKEGFDSCQGDSGGPLVHDKNGRWELQGVVSFGKGCAQKHPGVYTRVTQYLPWIEKTAKSLSDYY